MKLEPKICIGVVALLIVAFGCGYIASAIVQAATIPPSFTNCNCPICGEVPGTSLSALAPLIIVAAIFSAGVLAGWFVRGG